MEMFNFVLDSFKRGIFDFKVKRQDLIAGTVLIAMKYCCRVNNRVRGLIDLTLKVNKTRFCI